MKAVFLTAFLLLCPALASADPCAPLALVDDLAKVAPSARVKAALECIETLDRSGPTLQSVLAVDPNAARRASQMDTTRAIGPLWGMPILVKDNIAVAGLSTTAGSRVLSDNVAATDAPLIAQLRKNGLVILGKANLSEWGNIRGSRSIGGWSTLGGQTRYPYALDRSPDGSSSGSAVAVAAGIVPLAIGTETDGSITHPASVNGIVGLKPTVGLVSRKGIIPISSTQDTAGPMARSVRDAALLLDAMTTLDPDDPRARKPVVRGRSYAANLRVSALDGARLGVMRWIDTGNPEVESLFRRALADLERAGAILIDLNEAPDPRIDDAEFVVLMTELKAGLDQYLAATPAAVRVKSLDDVIAANRQDQRALSLFGQQLFERAASTRGLEDPVYIEARALASRLAGEDGLDRMIAEHRLDALVGPTSALARPIDPAGASIGVGRGANRLPAVAGAPHLTVPMGQVHGLPVGLSIIGPAWSEQRLLEFGYAYEQRTHHRRAPTYPQSILDRADIAAALARDR